jgi:hypothetical protein
MKAKIGDLILGATKLGTVSLAVVVISLSLSATASKANVIQNGDFSTGDFTGWTLFRTLDGDYNPVEQPYLPAVNSFDVTGGGASLAAEFNVGGSTGSQNGGGIYQTVATGAGSATFSASIASSSICDTCESNADGGIFTALLDGTPMDSFTVGSIATDTIIRSTLSFSAPVSAGLHEIRILITRAYGNSPITPHEYVDNVVFDAPSVGAVPLPAALPLFASGLGAFGLLSWRRRRKAQAAA